MQRIGLAVLLVMWLGSAAAADSSVALKGRQAEAQAQQARLRDRIDTLQKDIVRQESSRKDAANALRESEKAISDIDRRLLELDQQQRQAEADIKRLEEETVQQNQILTRRRAELADQLRAQYASGLSPWAALLSGDDPQAIGRELGYLSYVSQAQAEAVRAVDESIQTLTQLQARTAERRKDLARLEQETRSKKAELVAQKAERQRVLNDISEQLKQQKAQAETLQRDDQRLGRLITGLEAAIAKQVEEERIAEERRREAARQEEARRREAERLAQEERKRREQELLKSRRDQEAATRAREQVEAARARERAQEQSQAAAPAAPSPATALQGLSQGLPYPVRGQVQGRFGMERPEGGRWRGIVLRAQEGTRVNAIAAGRVVYADWLNGFGNILILDHGQQYLSVYAYNQSLLKQVGQVVSAGEAIATVGATGGQVESGLYFEIRHQGKPVNPLLWLAR